MPQPSKSSKRARPSFSPPRPGGRSKQGSGSTRSKSNVNGTSKKNSHNGVSKRSTGQKNTKGRKRTSAIALVDDEASSEGDGDEEHEDMNVDETDSNSDDNTSQDTADSTGEQEQASSPEPSVILAEVTREDDSSADQHIIPVPLLHRILHQHFSEPSKTKMSTDARTLISRYIETFVREAIARSSFENEERNKSGGGWLEIEDLERTAVQLCLDF